MPQRHASRETLDGMPRIDDVLPIDQREFLRHAPFADLRLDPQRERRDASSLLRANDLPSVAGDLPMRRMFFTRDLVRISAKRQAEKISAQRHQHRRRHLRRLFILPRADVVRPHRSRAVAEKSHRCHVPAELGHGDFDLFGSEEGAGLAAGGAKFRVVCGGCHRGGRDRREWDEECFGWEHWWNL